MFGTIKAYSHSVNAGIIESSTGTTYGFREDQWRGSAMPAANEEVSFVATGPIATHVRSAQK